ncbi:MAG: thiamine pyrophosphate-dependent dehydrogenase E1 component subunit alpha [Acetobacteraceae bacterium]|nr:thiamine pyrophosphate-dependent dehydrogenase E1 component subunit alpha [Acetobacteraceae bacterium]
MQLNRDALLKAYRDMVTIRRFEERVQEEFSKGNIPGFVHLYAGQEASAVGICAHLGADDRISSTHRGHGHSLAKGCDVSAMMAELFARGTGLCGGKGGSMHIADLDRGMLGANGIVGGGPPLVVGAALAAKTLGTGNVAVAFLGDGASNQGTTFEAMNMAVVLKLPAIFAFENNGYGEYTAAAYAVGSGDIAGRAAGFGMPAVKVDGDDFFAVHAAAQEAVERARNGGGPSAIEVDTCRFYGHHSGDAQLYRGKDEVKRLREERDCLQHFRRRVGEAALLETSELDAIDVQVAAVIEAAVAAAKDAPPPAAAALFSDVYVSYPEAAP